MGKTEIVCSHCGKQKIQVQTDEKKRTVKKVKGGSWDTLLTQVDESHWRDDHALGIVVRCKCGKYTFLYDFVDNPNMIRVEDRARENQSFSGFCQACAKAFIAQVPECPSCGAMY